MTGNHKIQEMDIALIELIRAAPCLYDTRNSNFRLIYKKDEAWEEIGNEIGMTPIDARKRFTCLRDRYARDLRHLQDYPESRELEKNEFFLRMNFLRYFVKTRKKRVSVYSSKKSADEPPHKINETTVIESYEDNVEEEEHFEGNSNGETNEYVYEVTSEEKHHPDKIENGQDDEITPQQDYQQFIEDQAEVTSYEPMSSNPQPTTVPVLNIIHKDPLEFKRSAVSTTPSKLIAATQLPTVHHQKQPDHIPIAVVNTQESNESEEFFSKTIASYLKELSRRHKIKAKIEMMQILEKYIDIEENEKREHYFKY